MVVQIAPWLCDTRFYSSVLRSALNALFYPSLIKTTLARYVWLSPPDLPPFFATSTGFERPGDI